MQSETGDKLIQLSPFLSLPLVRLMNPVRNHWEKKNKNPSSYQNHRWKPLLLIVSRTASPWHVVCIHLHTVMHVHTCIHALCLHRAMFCSVLCWRVPKLEFKAMMKGCLGRSSRSVPKDWSVVRKCRWSMCFLGPLQSCRCEKWSKLPLCQWRSIILACSFGSFLLFDCVCIPLMWNCVQHQEGFS